MVLASTPGRLIGGVLSDRVDRNRLKYIHATTSILEFAGLVTLMFSRTLWMVYVYSLLRGLGMGMRTGASTQISGRYFGRKAYSTITGTIALIGLPAGIFAPIYVGWLFDTTGSYWVAFEQAVIVYIISIILWYFYDPPKQVAVISDIKRFI
jgi:nitrate/nitrite transporter NarK